MLNRISNFLLKPHQIPSKLLRHLKQLWVNLTYDPKFYEAEQIKFFGALGLDYLESKKTLSEIYDQYPDFVSDTTSCHHNLFAAFSKTRPEFKKILEIGTHSGTGTVLLSILFPHALVETIDLPDEPSAFGSSYGHDEAFIKKRNSLLSSRHNIIFNQIDSVALTFANTSTYDFIWVDGDHEYPLVTVDIANCLRLLSDDGLVVCDDVRKKNSPTFDTIQKFVYAKLIKSCLVHKRISKPRAHQIGKFIAVLSRENKKEA